MSTLGRSLKIVTRYWPPPIPNREFDWSAIDENTYDGADDSSTRNQIGFGATEAAAIADLKEMLIEELKHEHEHEHE